MARNHSMRKKKTASYFIEALSEEDIPLLIPIIKYWVRDGDKVHELEAKGVIRTMRESLLHPSDSRYLVARNDSGQPLGVMGFGTLNAKLASYRSSPTGRSVGLLTVFLSPAARGHGLGESLLLSLFAKARETGVEEMIWSSHPRFRETAWPFYSRMSGNPIATIHDLFFPGSISPIWRKSLTQ
jgi:L-amino acid N-acyltransferase YncA